MSQLEKQIFIRLRTFIDDAGDVEETNTFAKGQLKQKGKFHVLKFKEQMGEDVVLDHFITIQTNQVSIRRTGFITMQQKFINKKVTENLYQHPLGKMHMETFTKQIDFTPLIGKQAGKLVLFYTLKLNGQNERQHTLELLFSEEEFHEHS